MSWVAPFYTTCILVSAKCEGFIEWNSKTKKLNEHIEKAERKRGKSSWKEL